MKFINLCLEQNNQLVEEYKLKPFVSFIRSQGLHESLEKLILYAIALVAADQSVVNNQVTTEEGLSLIKDYIKSVGRYGATPFLYPLYGTSELSQAYCRLCAVNNGVYVLRRTVKDYVINKETNKLDGIICTAGQSLNTKFLITDFDSLPAFQEAVKNKYRGLLRCVCVVNKSISPSNLRNVLVIIPPNTTPFNNPNSIYLFQFDRSMFVCPTGQYLIHITTPSSQVNGGKTASKEALSSVVEFFFGKSEENLEESKPSGTGLESNTQEQDSNSEPKHEISNSCVLWQAYWTQLLREIEAPNSEKDSALPSNVFVCSDATVGLGHAADLKEAKSIFSAICPDMEFLPTEPHEELDEEVLREARLLQQQNEAANS